MKRLFFYLLVASLAISSGCLDREITPEVTTTTTIIITPPARTVAVTTDKADYQQEEIIVVTITNNLLESIFTHSGKTAIKYLEKKTADQWEKLGVKCKYPHCIYGIGPPDELLPGQVRTFEWQPLISINGTREYVTVDSGHYRLAILYQNFDKSEWLSVNSNEFFITAPGASQSD